MTRINTHAGAFFQRAMILYEQRRFGDAERELRQALGTEPSNAETHAMLSLCLAQLQRLPEATEEAKQAIGLAPDLPFAHYALASVMYDRNRYEEALAAVNQALSFNSQNPSYLSLLSAIHFGLRNWPAALDAAERGLVVDPEHERCVNLRAMALVKMGRRAEAGAAIGAALARDPDDALTHANQGWTLLHQGDYRKAMEHFREALRLQPQLDWARAGMVESLKARNPIYKVILAYFLFMSRLSSRAQWGIIMTGYFGSRMLSDYSHSNPALRPYVLPVILAYSGFAFLTWVANPLFNLLLRLDRFGRYALSDEQIWGANCSGAVMLLAIIFGVFAWSLHSADLAFAALGTLFFLIPVSAIFTAPNGWPRYALIAYAAVLGILGAGALSGIFPAAWQHGPSPQWAFSIGTAFLWGVILNQFVANGLFGVRVRK